MVEPRRKRGVGTSGTAGTRVASYEYRRFLGQRTTTFPGYKASIRLKRDRWMKDDPKAATFLRASQTLIAMFLTNGVAAGESLDSLVKLLCIFADRAVKESRPPEYYTNLPRAPTSYPVQKRRESETMMTAREVYAALENPAFAVPEAMVRTAPPGSPKHVTVLIVEDEIAEEIKLDPRPFASALRGQIAAELAKVICDYWGVRVSDAA
jgi:hypothetical protein